MSVLITVPQIVVAALAPWVGYHSETRGRRPLLLLGFAIEPLRTALLAVSTAYPVLVVAQVLDGFSGAIITVLTVLVITGRGPAASIWRAASSARTRRSPPRSAR